MFLVDATAVYSMIKRIVTVGLVCCLCISMVGIAVADSESIRAANAIDTPEESPSGTTITVNHIGVFDHDEQIEATITGPDETYDIGLFDSSDSEIDSQSDVAETVTFDSSDLDPGSYHLSVTNTAFSSMAPIVISGYDIAVSSTENTDDNQLIVNATVTETAVEGAPHGVDAVVWNDETETRTELTADGEFSTSGEYTGTVSLEQFDGEPYQVYVVATDDNEIYSGENELLAVGEDPDNQDYSDESDDTSQSTGGASTGSGTSSSSDDDESQNQPNESDDTVDDSSVIEPNTSTNGESTTADDESQTDDEPVDGTADDTPISMVIPVVALLLAAFGIARVKN